MNTKIFNELKKDNEINRALYYDDSALDVENASQLQFGSLQQAQDGLCDSPVFNNVKMHVAGGAGNRMVSNTTTDMSIVTSPTDDVVQSECPESSESGKYFSSSAGGEVEEPRSPSPDENENPVEQNQKEGNAKIETGHDQAEQLSASTDQFQDQDQPLQIQTASGLSIKNDTDYTTESDSQQATAESQSTSNTTIHSLPIAQSKITSPQTQLVADISAATIVNNSFQQQTDIYETSSDNSTVQEKCILGNNKNITNLTNLTTTDENKNNNKLFNMVSSSIDKLSQLPEEVDDQETLITNNSTQQQKSIINQESILQGNDENEDTRSISLSESASQTEAHQNKNVNTDPVPEPQPLSTSPTQQQQDPKKKSPSIKFHSKAKLLIYDGNSNASSLSRIFSNNSNNNSKSKNSFRKFNRLSRRISSSFSGLSSGNNTLGSRQASLSGTVGNVNAAIGINGSTTTVGNGSGTVRSCGTIEKQSNLKNRVNVNREVESMRAMNCDRVDVDDFLCFFETHERRRIDAEPYLNHYREKQVENYYINNRA
ncbi:unnamed protein product [Ambrosiozyma monospora]|uniref:Unnamed protein product n=1 Tax=Ambrosiozyma monospora TaxID=43982 RepID=A0ACB5SXR7_AMBMO|nr:unnamed protein product [Ambrosiozyma monospora]